MKISKAQYHVLTAGAPAQVQGGARFNRDKTVWFPKESNWPMLYPTK